MEHEIVSLAAEYEAFEVVTRGLPFEEQLREWDCYVEGPHRQFYECFIGKGDRAPQARKFFGAMPRLHMPMMEEFDIFPGAARRQLENFREMFPDMGSMTVYAAPSLLNFNGKCEFMGGRQVVAFGMDMIALLKDDPGAIPGMMYVHDADVLYAHEIFHAYHGTGQNLAGEGGTMADALWQEGLATLASAVSNPSADMGALFMDSMLEPACAPLVRELREKFAAVMDLDMHAPGGHYSLWFTANGGDAHTPSRAGYYLGYLAAREIAGEFGLREAISWSPEKAREILRRHFAGTRSR